MVVSMLLECFYDVSFWLRILFIAIGIIATAGISENVSVTGWFFVYCVLQRVVLSVVAELLPGFPGWPFMIGLAIEIILAVIVLIMDIGDGPLCILRTGIFLYENWLVSSILARLVYGFIVEFSITGFAIVIIVLLIIFFVT